MDNKNPHTVQYEQTFEGPIRHLKLDRDLKLGKETFEYNPSLVKKWSTLHWGQRKLFLTELEFLTRYLGDKSSNVVVDVGAAPGAHLMLLLELFPQLKFILYDPRDFDVRLRSHPRVEIHKKFFTDKEASIYRDKKVLYICDIRSANPSKEPPIVSQRKILKDMRDQERWYNIMQPEKAILKFHPPFPTLNDNKPNPILRDKPTFNYLDGEVLIQPFARITSTETRLIPNGKRKNWNVKEYESACFTHNIYMRTCLYDYEPSIKGLDHCYDCACEVYLWEEYIKKYKSELTVQQLSNLLNLVIAKGKFTPLTYIDWVPNNE